MSKSLILDDDYPEVEMRCLPEASLIAVDKRTSDNSFCPFEYAFYLLGSVRGKTVVEVGALDEFSRPKLRQLGARLMSASISDDTVVVPIRDGSADHVFCGSILRRVNPIIMGRQLRRLLKPGGTVVFNERIDHESIVRIMRLMRSEYNPVPSRPMLTLDAVQSVSRAVGAPGRKREFWVTTPILDRMGFAPISIAGKISQRLDAVLLRSCRFMRRFALRLVWEARKEC